MGGGLDWGVFDSVLVPKTRLDKVSTCVLGQALRAAMASKEISIRWSDNDTAWVMSKRVKRFNVLRQSRCLPMRDMRSSWSPLASHVCLLYVKRGRGDLQSFCVAPAHFACFPRPNAAITPTVTATSGGNAKPSNSPWNPRIVARLPLFSLRVLDVGRHLPSGLTAESDPTSRE